jgi:hypothetical protein
VSQRDAGLQGGLCVVYISVRASLIIKPSNLFVDERW